MAKKRAGCLKRTDRGEVITPKDKEEIKLSDKEVIKPPDKTTNQDGGGGSEGRTIYKK
jgi:hypothetical protein